MPDIDIDFADRLKALSHLKHVQASRKDMAPHNTGVYLHTVPVHAPSGLCITPYEEAEDLGYFKVDFLNVGVYNDIQSEEELESLKDSCEYLKSIGYTQFAYKFEDKPYTYIPEQYSTLEELGLFEQLDTERKELWGMIYAK